ncbi:MAG: RraA family protein [Rhodobacteraceae bacterium]|nr:RraA family protein [Paracoccaceae bacterium]MCY4197997.1 RraA family protein [Paracoccaceae bacterium]MCY4327252.1 RraA family protein [Paracoccaceae bacterium]
MDQIVIEDRTLALLRQVDTPTVCNAIEVAQGRRGFSFFTRGTMQHSRPGSPPIVGLARTARIASAAPATAPPETLRKRRMDYYRYMASGTGPRCAVIEDVDYPDAIGAWWGEINVAVHKGLGMVGAVTNGVIRDLDVIDPDFPLLAGSIGVSHGFVHIVETHTTVDVMGLRVRHGDLIHADRHGALVIPASDLPGLEESINSVIAHEAIILNPARAGDFDIDKLETAWAAFETERT